MLETFLTISIDTSTINRNGVFIKQENYGRFTQETWNIIKSIEITGEQAYRLRLMIEAKTETITLYEIKAMVYAVVRENINK